MTHRFPIRVYYEDTDMAGIVYYANYLKFIERGRSEWLRALGVDQTAMKAQGVVFAARRIEADYIAPARFDDALVVETRITALTPARIVMAQDVARDGAVLFSASVTIVCVGAHGRATRIPEAVRAALAGATDLA